MTMEYASLHPGLRRALAGVERPSMAQCAEVMQVERHPSGNYTVPCDAVHESPADVLAERGLDDVSAYGELAGWGRWTHVFEVGDRLDTLGPGWYFGRIARP